MKTRRLAKSLLMLLLLSVASPYFAFGGEYTLIDLGTLGGPESTARGINDNRQVTGISHVTETVRHAYVWDEVNGMRDLGTLGGTDSGGIAINNSGKVGGWSDFDGNEPFHTFFHDGTTMHDLGTLGGDYSIVFAMNDNDQLVGRASLDEGMYHAFLYENDVMHDLGTLGGTNSRGFGINEHGQVVGDSTLPGNVGQHAFIWDQSNGMQSLGTLGGEISGAFAINNLGQVTGRSQYSSTTYDFHVFLWDETNGMQDLVGLDGGGTGYAINDKTQITGDSDGRAFVWDRVNGMRDLCVVTNCTDKGWTDLRIGRSINNHGDIVGEGIIDGVNHAFLALAPDKFVVEIDVLPKKDVNKINLNSKGSIQVVILSTDYFHAYNEVEPASVRFGPANAVAIRYKIKDTNHDSLPDMVFYFKIRETGIECGDSEATLSGETYEGAAFEGTDTIVTTGCGE